MIQIRKATPDDVDSVTDFNARLAVETEDRDIDASILREGVLNVLKTPELRGQYFVAEKDGLIVGQLAITYEWSDWRNGWFWWFQSVYVPETARQQGVFSALYDHVLNLARRDAEVCGLRLYVKDTNTKAQLTYKQRGMDDSGYRIMEIETRS